MKFLFLALPVGILAACASPYNAADGGGSLEQRVVARWDLLVQGNIADAYGFLSPAARDVTSLGKYQGSIKSGMWRGAAVDKVACASDDLCTVSVRVSYAYKPKGAPVFENVKILSETWRKDGGQWWYVHDQ